ncbi:uncharacterized protein LOC128210961 [Mya arenaria]|uniref:uncharacterized protein LOC128210961 n=1 Tax=Mya arenaria TaxID=6604 RepID=UPI0022E37E3A|nr:uncharacterized protein LOC128210961 [Mya arenaria]
MEKSGSFSKMAKALPKTEKTDSIQKSPSDDSLKQPLQSILVKCPSGDDEESFFKMGKFRPRAMTDPISPRPRLHVHFDLPDITVDDCSDDEDNDEFREELANTNEGAFFVFKSPPRQRSNTCPMNMFSKRQRNRRNRPATPPPADEVPHDAPRYPSWERVPFSPHALTSVEETETVPSKETVVTTDLKSVTKSESTGRVRKLSTGKSPKSRNIVSDVSKSQSKGSGPRLTNGHLTSKQGNPIDITG